MPGASPGGSEGSSQGSGESEGVQLTAAQELMIQQLVAAQLQCNKRSFSDQPKVTVPHLGDRAGPYSQGSGWKDGWARLGESLLGLSPSAGP